MGGGVRVYDSFDLCRAAEEEEKRMTKANRWRVQPSGVLQKGS